MSKLQVKIPSLLIIAVVVNFAIVATNARLVPHTNVRLLLKEHSHISKDEEPSPNISSIEPPVSLFGDELSPKYSVEEPDPDSPPPILVKEKLFIVEEPDPDSHPPPIFVSKKLISVEEPDPDSPPPSLVRQKLISVEEPDPDSPPPSLVEKEF